MRNSKSSKRTRPIRILTVCGSPVGGSSTELLLKRVGVSLADNMKRSVRQTFVLLNELDIAPCQACGEDPTPAGCFIDDDMTALYPKIMSCDCLLLGTPIYFDSMSAQSKLFIDRCNCLRPANFDDPKCGFVKRIERQRPGAMVLVGSDIAWFEGARRSIAGFFKWINVDNRGVLKFVSKDINRIGEVIDDKKTLAATDRLGMKLAREMSGVRE